MRADYDVAVVGGGHAGVEACSAAARAGATVALITSSVDGIGQMSCNPAIGGIAKGTVVREVDALGGIMARAADRATIQFRMLNRAKGAAVWAPRAQCDRVLYRQAAGSLLAHQPGLTVLQGTVASLIIERDRVAGVVLADGSRIRTRGVVVTAGTFLRGRIHIGTDWRIPGGRSGDPAVVALAEQLEAIGLEVARFKTGTPPRIDGQTVDYHRLERQDGELPAFRFSHFERAPRGTQRPCWITWAGEATKAIVRARLEESALYGGAIAARGPRYCPSIEDKIVKFPHAPRHQVFLEPEGLDSEEMYVNGLSTSLPTDAQIAMLRSIEGLERAQMTRAGYAIEYDYYPPRQLTPWLEVRALANLFFAGQINGTTGYEEAAAQGVVAGLNAALRVREQPPLVIRRSDAYIGVLVDDLTSRGVDEPYRLFTSRSEFRLLLRHDNALRRLFPIAERLRLLRGDELVCVERRLLSEAAIQAAAETRTISLKLTEGRAGGGPAGGGGAKSVAELARRPNSSLAELLRLTGDAGLDWCEEEAFHSVEMDIKYNGYIERELIAAKEVMQLYDTPVPVDFTYAGLKSLSSEARERLSIARPSSLGGAATTPGVSASDLYYLAKELAKTSSPGRQ